MHQRNQHRQSHGDRILVQNYFTHFVFGHFENITCTGYYPFCNFIGLSEIPNEKQLAETFLTKIKDPAKHRQTHFWEVWSGHETSCWIVGSHCFIGGAGWPSHCQLVICCSYWPLITEASPPAATWSALAEPKNTYMCHTSKRGLRPHLLRFTHWGLVTVIDYLLITACNHWKERASSRTFAGKSKHHLDLVHTCFTPTNLTFTGHRSRYIWERVHATSVSITYVHT